MQTRPGRNHPPIPSPRDEQILKAVYTYRYMTARDMAYLLFSPTCSTMCGHAWRGWRVARISPLQTYLCRFQLLKVGDWPAGTDFYAGREGSGFSRARGWLHG